MIGSGGHFRHLVAEGCDPMAAIIAVGDNAARKMEAEAHLAKWATFISSKAMVYVFHEEIGDGSQIMAGAVVHAGMGRHCIIGNNAVLSHDCHVADYVFIGPGAVVCGGAVLGEGCFIGAGAVVCPGAVVPPWKLVKACDRWNRK